MKITGYFFDTVIILFISSVFRVGMMLHSQYE